jgi:hypothetical protein
MKTGQLVSFTVPAYPGLPFKPGDLLSVFHHFPGYLKAVTTIEIGVGNANFRVKLAQDSTNGYEVSHLDNETGPPMRGDG